MGVLLLLSQERWQKFVSFGFDHIISGFCYLIRQKFKLISFSIACWGVSCTVWSGFWQVFNGGKKRKPLFGSCSGGKEGKPFTWAPGATSAFQKRSAMKSSHLSLGGVTAQGQVGGGLGQLEPTVIRGPKRKVGRWIHSQSCVQGPLTLHNVVKYIIRLSKSHFCGSSLKCAIAQALIRGSCQQDVHLFFFLSIHSLQG